VKTKDVSRTEASFRLSKGKHGLTSDNLCSLVNRANVGLPSGMREPDHEPPKPPSVIVFLYLLSFEISNWKCASKELRDYLGMRSFNPAGAPSPPVGEGNCGAVSMQLAPLLSQCRHAKRWEAEPFRNLITFQLDDVADGGGKNGSKHGGRRVGTNFAKKERR
jgi:hypothetical protein